MNDLRRLRALAAFLPELAAPDFVAGEMAGFERVKPGVFTMPYATMSPGARRFYAMLYKEGWVSVFDWPAWANTAEAIRLRNDPAALAEADVGQLRKLLTTCVRRDRFAEGSLLADFDSGLMLRIVRRADALLRDEMEEGG